MSLGTGAHCDYAHLRGPPGIDDDSASILSSLEGALTTPQVSIVMPVFKEGEAVEPVLRTITAAIGVPHEILVVYDFDEDPTVPVLRHLASEYPTIEPLRNDLGQVSLGR